MARSSPRARAGFSMLDASIAPSAAPAPTSVCSSSMKRMICPCESSISFRTAFKRSSNSPRYLAPASIDPRSREITRLFFQTFGHVAGNNALREAFDDSGLADARFADEDGIIFRAAGKDLDDAANFFISSNDRIKLAATRLFGQVASIFVESLKLGFRILVGHFLRSTDNDQSFEDRVIGRAVTSENLLRDISLEVRDREKQVLGRNVFIFEVGCFFESLVQQLVGFAGERGPARLLPRPWEVFAARHKLR